MNQYIRKIENDFKTVINQACTRKIAIEVGNLVQVKQVKTEKQQAKYNNVDWKFSYFYDYRRPKDRFKRIHGIYDNGKTLECEYDKWDGCACFSRISFGMKPNSGKYKIKFKINIINNTSRLNAIGITCNTHSTNNSQSKHNYWYYSHDYIAWSSLDNQGKDHKNVPNGLICGGSDKHQCGNIFILSNFEYMSNNDSYLQRLPYYKSGDIIELRYDSNNNALSFFKSNDPLLNSKIVNVAKDKTFYWIVGHSHKKMSVTILRS